MINASVISNCEKSYNNIESLNTECHIFFDSDLLSVCRLRSLGLLNEIRNCRFRSVCWRVYLRILSENIDQWHEQILLERCIYENIRQKYIVDPRHKSDSEDHPLSLRNDSRWNQYFQRQDFMKSIKQDLSRTFPDIKFFHDTSVRTSMINVLYCHSQMSRFSCCQGMHEILAPIVFALHCDYITYEDNCESYHLSGSTKDVGNVLFDSGFLEHDTYSIFSHLMRFMESWYDSSINIVHLAPLTDKQPFSQPKKWMPECLIGVKLSTIHNNVLRRQDLDLFLHLEHLEILPQMFGLRWLKLLFVREFSMHDILVVWDVLFAAGDDLSLADHIYVSMLVHIRDYLLAHDLAACLDRLMHYPDKVDVNLVIDYALHLFDPDHYDRPHDVSRNQDISILTVPRRRRRSHRSKTSIGLETFTSKLSSFIGNTAPGELSDPSSRQRGPIQLDAPGDRVDVSEYLQISVPSERHQVMRLCADMVDQSLASIRSLSLEHAVVTLQRTRQLLEGHLSFHLRTLASQLPLLDLNDLIEEGTEAALCLEGSVGGDELSWRDSAAESPR